MKTMYFVYAILNKKHDKIYIGQTKNLKERVTLHNNKIFVSSYTARYDGKWELFYHEKCKDRKNALLREKQLKSFRGREFLKNLLNIPR